MNDTLTIKKRGLTERLKEKLVAPKGARTTTLPQPADDVDPLVDFLARYDVGFESEETAAFTAELPVEEEKRYLSFDLAGEEYAASIMDIREILKVTLLTEVPRAPQGILGVTSKRGVVMPVVDLAASIGLRAPDPSYAVEQRILVVGDGDRVCGLRVDRVREVVRLAQSAVEEVPPSLGARQAQMLHGLGKAGDRMLILLDVGAVLDQLAQQAGLPSVGEPRGAEAR